MDLYNKLLKCGIFRANPRVKNNFEKKKTLLDPDTSAIFENGVALGKYLLVLKDALVKLLLRIYRNRIIKALILTMLKCSR